MPILVPQLFSIHPTLVYLFFSLVQTSARFDAESLILANAIFFTLIISDKCIIQKDQCSA